MTCTPAEVKAITGSTLDDSAITPFINAADCMIEDIADCISGKSDACQTQICIYLSAHLLVSSPVGKASQEIKSEALENVYKRTYNTSNVVGEGITATNFGKTANMLSDGCLGELHKSPANLFSIGTIGDDSVLASDF